jgi:hypothetical protein
VKISFFVRKIPEKLENGAWDLGVNKICNSWSIWDHGKETEEVRARESRRRRDSCACGQGKVLSRCEWRYFSPPFYTYRMSTKYSSTWHSHPVITGWPSPAGIYNVRVLLFRLTCSHLIEAKGSTKARSQFSRWYFPRG